MRVRSASVTIEEKVAGQIGVGFLILLGVHEEDTEKEALKIADKICAADVVVWATPIYYYEMSGQMKTMIDRANSLYSRDYKFREVYLLSCAADDSPETDAGAAKGVQGWVDCFDKATFSGKLFVGGVNDVGEIEGNEGLTKAFEMGKKIR